MTANISPDFYIFRDGRTRAHVPERKARLVAALEGLPESPRLQDLLPLLLRAGELDCALEDAGSTDRQYAALLTDLLAAACIDCDTTGSYPLLGLQRLAGSLLEKICDTADITIATPEGFAYYGLHPLDYADLVTRVHIAGKAVMVIGIRSIGTTLSAVIAAKLRALGIEAQRTTVRPEGHPYDRRCELNGLQKLQIQTSVGDKASFLICDEGPGRSGSSLLSVAEALTRAGVSSERIQMLCAHEPDVAQLCAPDAATRWSLYRVQWSGKTRRLPADLGEDISGGKWRHKFGEVEQRWPAAWPQLERMKFLSRDAGSLLKFEGHGHFGEQVRARNEALAESGFGPPYCGQTAGFGKFPLQTGRLGRTSDRTPYLLTRMAEYCAWRGQQFAVSGTDTTELETMCRVNHARERGTAALACLPVARPVIADGRMQPHEWFLASDGRWIKLDGATHGDDHFFPGPCDIAWDLAGVTVEWQLDSDARNYFLCEYARVSEDEVAGRIDNYETAYAIFRLAWSKMAAASVQGTGDEDRLLRDYHVYRETLHRLAEMHGVASV